MPILPPITGYPNKVSDVTDLVRATLNDRATDPITQQLLPPATFTDTNLLPFLNGAYRRLQCDLAQNGLKFLVADAVITVAAGITILDWLAQPPLLPLDFVFPWKISECPTESSPGNLTPMVLWENGLPDRTQQTQLRDWSFVGGFIQLVGALQSNDIHMRYERALPALTLSNSSTDPLLLPDPVDALAARTAAGAARARGVRELAQDLEAIYDDEMHHIVSRYFKPKQRQPVRRLAYGSRRRGFRLFC